MRGASYEWLGIEFKRGVPEVATTTLHAAAATEHGNGEIDRIIHSPATIDDLGSFARTVHREKVVRASMVRNDVRALLMPNGQPRIGSRVAFEPFPGEQYVATLHKVESHVEGGATWVGKFEGRDDADVALTLTRNSIHGVADFGGRLHVMSGGPDGDLRVFEPDVSEHTRPSCTELPAGTARKSQPAPWAAPKVSPGRTIDVLVLYTSAAAGRYDMTSLINTAAASLNAAFDNSGVDAAVRIVGYHPTSYVEERDGMGNAAIYAAAAQLFIEDIAFGSEHPEISALRDDLGADLVYIITDASAWVDSCGVGLLMDDPADFPYPTNSADRWVAITGDTCIDDFRNFAHEIGHNLGGRHDWDGAPYFGTSAAEAFTTTGYGYTNTVGVEFRDIMGSGGNCSFGGTCTRLNRWSDPSATYSSYPLGHTAVPPDTASADLVDSLDTTVPLAAAYKTTADPAPGAPGSVTVSRQSCYGLNLVSWAASSGSVGWYEVETSTGAGWTQVYRGPQQTIEINVAGTTSVRAKACNATGCSSTTAGNQTATYYPGCM